MSSPRIRFDDLPALEALVGGELGPYGPPVEVTQDMVQRYADLTGDAQWIHVDVERARSGPFGGTIAHGFLTLSLLAAYRPPFAVEIVGERSRVNYGSDSLRFVAPVPVPSTLRARSRLGSVARHAMGTLLGQSFVVEADERVVLTYDALVLYRA